MAILVTGSLAYDHIMVFKDEFRNHILPDKVHIINVAFNVDSLTQEFGGTAGNITYNIALLGKKPIIIGTVGKDAKSYLKRISEWGLKTEGIKILKDVSTAQAFITTDLEDNQITAFHGGAMYRAHEQPLSVVKRKVDLAIVAANGPQAMIDHARHCRAKKWKFWFDPGQAMSALTGHQLVACLKGSQGLIVNDYEWQVFQKKTGHNLGMVLEEVPYVLVTLGENGVEILSREGLEKVPAVSGIMVVDPTGAGDAFRAGLLYGLDEGHGITEACRYACAVASFAIESRGTQNHRFDLQSVKERIKFLCPTSNTLNLPNKGA